MIIFQKADKDTWVAYRGQIKVGAIVRQSDGRSQTWYRWTSNSHGTGKTDTLAKARSAVRKNAW